jgi:uncharacterized membrane protein YtjA (UPF0391 family)
MNGAAMLGWALTFLASAMLAALFGFDVFAPTGAGIAQILFVVFLALFVISVIVGFRRPHPPTV